MFRLYTKKNHKSDNNTFSFSTIFYALCICTFLLSSCTKVISISPEEQPTANPVAHWEQSLINKSAPEKVAMANTILSDSTQAFAMRQRATLVLASIHNAQTSMALASLAAIYKSAGQNQQIYLEETLLADLQKVTNNDIYQILGLITPELEAQFPYVLVIYVAAQRNLLQNSHAILDRLSSHSFFQSPKLAGTMQEAKQQSSGAIAVLLPQSGNIAPIAQEITAGIEAARTYLHSIGSAWEVYYIDTQNPTWIQQVQALPPHCVTIGGPLQNSDFELLKQQQIYTSHAIFPFVSRLPNPEDEGVIVWQFFTKPEDQINAILNIASQSLGITEFGVFAPMSPYGTSMAKLFSDIALSKGFQVKTAQYPLDEVKDWSKLTQQFLDSYVPVKKKPPVVRAPIEAVFLPDAWRNIDFLVSTLHYHGAYDKVILGSSLWEQSLNQKQNINPKTFGLTLFPVTYDASMQSPIHTLFTDSLTRINMPANDWSSLGFDFMIMASELNLSSMQPAPVINARLSGLQLNYVAAPFRWDNNGIAHRFLFIDQPAREGRIPLDLPAFLAYKNNGGTPPNAPLETNTELTEEAIQTNENDALNEVDALINNITGQ